MTTSCSSTTRGNIAARAVVRPPLPDSAPAPINRRIPTSGAACHDLWRVLAFRPRQLCLEERGPSETIPLHTWLLALPRLELLDLQRQALVPRL
eukprot:6492068-Amphidinium_carterae.1